MESGHPAPKQTNLQNGYARLLLLSTNEPAHEAIALIHHYQVGHSAFVGFRTALFQGQEHQVCRDKWLGGASTWKVNDLAVHPSHPIITWSIAEQDYMTPFLSKQASTTAPKYPWLTAHPRACRMTMQSSTSSNKSSATLESIAGKRCSLARSARSLPARHGC